MDDYEDYYEIIGVGTKASSEEIKRAYRDQCFILHPDRMEGVPESAKKRAEERLKKINRAYDVLKDPQSRQQYNSCRSKGSAGTSQNNGNSGTSQGSTPKPKPTVDPQHIRFHDVKAGEIKTATFIIDNKGGPCSKIWLSTPDPWLKVVYWNSLSDSETFPLEVQIEATGDAWDKLYTETIVIKLDSEETKVIIELKTRQKPVSQKTTSTASSFGTAQQSSNTSSTATTQPRGIFPFSMGWQITGLISSFILGIILIVLSFQSGIVSNFTPVFLSGFSLLLLTGYCGFRTKCLKNAHTMPLAVKVGTGVAIICGLIVLGAIALYVGLIIAAVALFFSIIALIFRAIFSD